MKTLQALVLLFALTPAAAQAQSPAPTGSPSSAPTSTPSAAPKRMASFRPPKGWMQTGQAEWTNMNGGFQTLRIAKSAKPDALAAADPMPGLKQAFAGIAGSNPDIEVTTVCDGSEKAYRTTATAIGGTTGPIIMETVVIGSSTVGLVTYSRESGKPVDPVAEAAINSLCWP